MAGSERIDSNMKEKIFLLDMDIEKDDFLSSWKSMSMEEGDTMDFDLPPVSKGSKKPLTEGDAMDFDLPPVSKGNKKSFDFDKADMDFNLDVDFGKISSFNIDMPDIDISPPLQQAGKSKENLNKSSSVKDKGKVDRFAFAFDFDEFENFNFDSSLTKEGSKAQKDKISEENSPNGTTSQDKEEFMHDDLIANMKSLEDGPQKPSFPDTEVNFDMDCQVGRSKDLENSNIPSNLEVDDSVTLAAGSEVAYDKKNCRPQTTIASRELPTSNQFEKLVSSEPVHLEVGIETDDRQDFSYEQSNSSVAQEKVDCMGTNATGSNIEHDVQMPSIVGSTCNDNHARPENMQHPQPAVAEKISCEKSEVVVNDLAIDVREGIEPGQVSSQVDKKCPKSSVSGIFTNLPSARKNQETASENLKLPLVSQPKDISEKETMKRREPIVTCLRSFLQSEKLECPMPKVAAHNAFSSSCTKKMDSIQPSIVEGRESDIIQGARKLVSLPLQHSNSKTLLKDISQTRSQENYKGLKTLGEIKADGLQAGNQPSDSSTTPTKDIVKPKSASRQRESNTKNPDTLSSTREIGNEAMQNSLIPTTLASIPATKSTPTEKQTLPSIESAKKAPELRKLSGLNLDASKSPIRKDLKSDASISQSRILSRKAPSEIAHFPDLQKQGTCFLSEKRKVSDKDVTDTLHPAKRPSYSLTASRDLVKKSETVSDKEVSNQSDREDNSIKSVAKHCQASTSQILSDGKLGGAEMSFITETASNIKLAESYSKQLDDLCNMLRKKQDEAKELLVRAIVNNNKLLMLNNPVFEVKIRMTQDLFAELTLNTIHG